MDLHDHYAAAALTGMLAYSHVCPSKGNWQENASVPDVAKMAHAYAQAMLEFRPGTQVLDQSELLDQAQATERMLRQQVKLLHDATCILRNALAGFRTTQQDFDYKEAARILDQVASLTHPAPTAKE